MSIERGASVTYQLQAFEQWLDDPDVTEICVNQPGEVWSESKNTWQRHEVESLTLDKLNSLATAVARFVDNDVSDVRPILSAVLPAGDRIQIVTSPACEQGTVSITIRKPTADIITLDEYTKQGFFDNVQPVSTDITATDRQLISLMSAGRNEQFLRLAVQSEKVIVVSGETGSGKTTLMKALMREIPPERRIVTIEDVPELFLPLHPNHVHLFYQAESAEVGSAQVTATALLKCCLRMKPDRIMLAEVRGGETYDFLNVAASGHGGSITSCHAGSCDLTFERMALMVLQSPIGRSLPYEVIRRLLTLVVDVVVHVKNDTIGGTGRHITGIWFEPERKQALQQDEAA